MAQDSIVGGLFGITPESLDLAQRQREQAMAIQYAGLDPMQRAAYGTFMAGQQLGRGIGSLLGIEDPQLKMVTQQQQILRGIDFNSPESLAQGARIAAEAGNAQLASTLSARSNQLQTSISQREASKAQAALSAGRLTSLEQEQEREKNLQEALSALPPDATDAQLQSVLRKYADSKTVLQSLEKKSLAAFQAEERAKIEQEKAQRRADERERDREFKLLIAGLSAQQRNATTELQRQLIQGKIDDAQAKRDEKIEKQLASAEGVVQGTQVVLGKIDEALGLIGKNTTGIGSYLSVVPGTESRSLSSALATIKARLGFDQLQQMRQASPTGGALGQVAVKELEALQAALASLDQGLDSKTLRSNLNQIKSSYENWRNAALKKTDKTVAKPEVSNQQPVNPFAQFRK